MTTIYMVRNAECEDLQDASSEFNEVGKKELSLIQSFFEGKKVDAVYISSLPSAAKTLGFLSSSKEIPVYVAEEFDERKTGPRVANLESFGRRQWSEHNYKLPGGESFLEAMDRVIDGLEKIVTNTKDQVNVVGSHSMVMAYVIHFFDETFTFDEYLRTNSLRPWIVKMEFEGMTLVSLEEIQCR